MPFVGFLLSEKFFKFLFFFLDHLLKFLLITLRKLLASKMFHINFFTRRYEIILPAELERRILWTNTAR